LVTDGICSKRLAPFLPELLDRLRRRQGLREFPIAVQQHVAGMSAATVDRALKPLREQTRARRGISTTKAGTLLKRQIPIRTFADWTDARPAFFEMDLVGQCGWSGPVTGSIKMAASRSGIPYCSARLGCACTCWTTTPSCLTGWPARERTAPPVCHLAHSRWPGMYSLLVGLARTRNRTRWSI